jgi:hypothetical protein
MFRAQRSPASPAEIGMDFVVVTLYLLVMLGVGWYSRRRARNEADFLVAGRRLGRRNSLPTRGSMNTR